MFGLVRLQRNDAGGATLFRSWYSVDWHRKIGEVAIFSKEKKRSDSERCFLFARSEIGYPKDTYESFSMSNWSSWLESLEGALRNSRLFACILSRIVNAIEK